MLKRRRPIRRRPSACRRIFPASFTRRVTGKEFHFDHSEDAQAFGQEAHAERSTSRRRKSFGEIMFKILQITASVLIACLTFGIAFGSDSETTNSQWIPTATFSQPRQGGSDNQTKTREIPSSLRVLTSSPTTNVRVEQALPLKELTLEENVDEVARILNKGNALMAQKNWYDAKKHYEKGLRRYPNNQVLQAKFAESRRRQEISVRYQDRAFASLTSEASVNDVLLVFDEVFLDIEKFHVDRPSYSTLFEFGIAGVTEALSENSFFLQNEISEESRQSALKALLAMRKKTDGIQFSTRDEVRRVTLWIARQLKKYAGIPETATLSEFLCSTVSSLDAYSSSLTPTQVEDVFSLIDGRFIGLGIELKSDAPTIIVRVIPGSPAEETGIVVGDEIVSIDGIDVAELTGTEIGELLQGREGEKASLILRSIDSQLRKVVATRRPIDVPSVENVHVLDPRNGIGYVRISCFQKTTASELQAAINQLSKSQIKGLIVDLRQNPGGLLQEAITVSDMFLNSGTIVQTQGRNGFHVFEAKEKTVFELPLALLVDSNSASAAEIFAGAMQDNGRAVVVGSQSYGKGTVQAIVQLSSETTGKKPIAGLRLTTEKFYSPKGRAYAGIGVTPDVIVEDDPKMPRRLAQPQPSYADQAKEKPSYGYIPTTLTKKTSESESDIPLSTAIREILKLVRSRPTPKTTTRSPEESSLRSAPNIVSL